jgi:hypothetical protein
MMTAYFISAPLVSGCSKGFRREVRSLMSRDHYDSWLHYMRVNAMVATRSLKLPPLLLD